MAGSNVGLPVMLRQVIDLAGRVPLSDTVWWQSSTLMPTLLDVNCSRIHLAEKVTGWPVRDQGESRMCVAYAVGAAIELQLALGQDPPPPPAPLSAGYLYWAMRNHPPPGGVPGWDGGSTRFECAVDALGAEGICPLDICPDALHGQPPPTDALSRAGRMVDLRSAVSEVPGQPPVGQDGAAVIRDFANLVIAELKAQRPVCMGFPVTATPNGSTNWNDAGERDGTVMYAPTAGLSDYTGGHAVCIVGFMPDATPDNQGGYFLFKNSLGPDFGARRAIPGVTGNGYGRISLRDAWRHCWDYFTLQPKLG